jgi:cytoskeletal protein CcmA (bactofilin family)
MAAAAQGLKSLSRYFGTVRHTVETGQEAATAAVDVIIDTIADSPAAALVRQDAGTSVIGSELQVVGTLMCCADMTIDGTMLGDIRGKGHVTIGKTGVVLGNIYAEEVTVYGRVDGTLNAREVRLCHSCRVKGEVVHARLKVEHGAFFEGDCDHSDDPAGESALMAQ